MYRSEPGTPDAYVFILLTILRISCLIESRVRDAKVAWGGVLGGACAGTGGIRGGCPGTLVSLEGRHEKHDTFGHTLGSTYYWKLADVERGALGSAHLEQLVD